MVMVTLVLLSFIILNQTYSFFRLKSENLLHTLKQNETLFFTPSDDIASEELEAIEKGFRGGFRLLKISSTFNEGAIEKIGLVGVSLKKENTTLYLQDTNTPLVMVGNASIKGKAYIPASGIKAGVISGTYFNGDKLVDGTTSASGSSLPSLESGYLSYLSELQTGTSFDDGEIVSMNAELNNSFYDPEKIVSSELPSAIYEKAYGNVRFQSSKEIVISREANLKDVLIVSPKVRIEKGFKGRIHIIARDSIIIEEGVVLDYPSSVVLQSRNENSSTIVIDEKSTVRGNIMYLTDSPSEKPNVNISVSKDAEVDGSIYCMGYLDLRGTVNGSVYTEHFMANESGGRYINHILDGNIVLDKDSEVLCTLPLKGKQKSVAQWMY